MFTREGSWLGIRKGDCELGMFACAPGLGLINSRSIKFGMWTQILKCLLGYMYSRVEMVYLYIRVEVQGKRTHVLTTFSQPPIPDQARSTYVCMYA